MRQINASWKKALEVLLSLCLLGGCSSTILTNQWTNPNRPAKPLKHLLVMGVSKQESIRRSFEDAFAEKLAELGVQVDQSYKFLNSSSGLSEGELREFTSKTGAEGALITRLVRRDKRLDVQPGTVAGPAAGPWYGYYRGAWGSYVEPPMVYEYEVVMLETNLWDLKNNQVLWAGNTETTASGDAARVIKDLVSVITQALVQSKLIG